MNAHLWHDAAEAPDPPMYCPKCGVREDQNCLAGCTCYVCAVNASKCRCPWKRDEASIHLAWCPVAQARWSEQAKQ